MCESNNQSDSETSLYARLRKCLPPFTLYVPTATLNVFDSKNSDDLLQISLKTGVGAEITFTIYYCMNKIITLRTDHEAYKMEVSF